MYKLIFTIVSSFAKMSVPRRKNVEIFLFSPVYCEMVRQTTLRPGQDQWGLHTTTGDAGCLAY